MLARSLWRGCPRAFSASSSRALVWKVVKCLLGNAHPIRQVRFVSKFEDVSYLIKLNSSVEGIKFQQLSHVFGMASHRRRVDAQRSLESSSEIIVTLVDK